MSTTLEFRGWPKIPRLFRDCIITEKIDGTNGCVIVTEDGQVAAQSRNRLLITDTDAFGFALWVEKHKDALRTTLGPGYHFGEWWGAGIQRRYGCVNTERRFSLFNTERWANEDLSALDGVLRVVPVLYRGPFLTDEVAFALGRLRTNGSYAAPGFMTPEGIIVYHTAANVGFKVTLERDGERKGEQS